MSGVNRFMAGILCSPLHWLASGAIMLITIKGRKSGKTYTLPVNYVRDGEDLLVLSYRHRTWWRNLVDGAPVTLCLKGKEASAFAETAVEGEAAAAQFARYLTLKPGRARRWHVRVEPDGRLNAEDLARVARSRVVTRIRLD